MCSSLQQMILCCCKELSYKINELSGITVSNSILIETLDKANSFHPFHFSSCFCHILHKSILLKWLVEWKRGKHQNNLLSRRSKIVSEVKWRNGYFSSYFFIYKFNFYKKCNRIPSLKLKRIWESYVRDNIELMENSCNDRPLENLFLCVKLKLSIL